MPVKGYHPHRDLADLLYGRAGLIILTLMLVAAVIVVAVFG